MKATDRQVGGNHYKNMVIEPAEYSYKNGLTSLEGSVVKYISRWRRKGVIQDLNKAIHCIELIKQYESELNADCNIDNDMLPPTYEEITEAIRNERT